MTLAERLSSPGPKRILALDGGGVRGIVSVAFLERLEALLAARHRGPAPFRLADYFDLIAGTSTGALIAASLALGMSAADIRRFYEDLAPRVFRRPRWRIAGVQSLFDAKRLMWEIAGQVGDRTLDSPDLRTGLVVVTKRMDTGSVWILTNIPGTRYWDTPPDGSFIGNRHYALARVLRASTAAPHFFDPEPISVVDGEAPGWFVDGAVSPHNNPALAALMVATLDAYNLRWRTGADALLIASVGTGWYRPATPSDRLRRMPAMGLAVRALAGMIADGQSQALTLLQALSRPLDPWPVNSEIGGLEADVLGGVPLFSFQRYDVQLDAGWIAAVAGVRPGERDLAALRRIDRPGTVPLAYRIATAAAEGQVRDAHFPPVFDPRREPERAPIPP
ncbi:MAG: patatin-like phospholipase family protein [Rhodospirillaceae bacterium]|nr:patatin-like phospholipase family protein [Rhodospirillaceae bacterium]